MVQSIGTTAASAELSGTGSITGFSSVASSGVLLAYVFTNGAEVVAGYGATTGAVTVFVEVTY